MPAPRPPSKPQITQADLRARIAGFLPRLAESDKVICVAIRGYYLDSIGKRGVNDVGSYDDAIFWIGQKHFSTWNCNTDPSLYGWNPGVGKYFARLQPGLWRFAKWKHKGEYAAFGQGENEVTVDRVRKDGSADSAESGCFGINIHRGGENGTSSWGCQTLVPNQWHGFQTVGYNLLGHYKQTSFPYILLEEERRAA